MSKKTAGTQTLRTIVERGTIMNGPIGVWNLLVGSEVKSLRAGRASIGEGYIIFENGEALIHASHLSTGRSAKPSARA